MALSRCAPRVEIAPPQPRPRRFGLFTTAEIRDVEDGNWSHGVQFRSESCAGSVYTWPLPCPSSCADKCYAPVPIVVDVIYETEEHDCTTYSLIKARVAKPATRADLPYRTVITVTSGCGSSVDIVPGAPECTLVSRVALEDAPKPIAVTVRQSMNGEEKTVKVAPCATAHVDLTADTTGPRRKALDGIGPWIGAEPFPVFSSVHCMPGAGFASEAKTLAASRLTCHEQVAVEEYLWTQMAGDGGQYVGNPANPQSITRAMSEVETALAQSRGCSVGVVHVPAHLSMALSAGSCCLVEEDAGTLHTRLGSQVVLGAGYDPRMRPDGKIADEDEVVIIGTGPVIIQRGPVSTYEGLDKETNDYAAIAERTFAVIADCPLVWTVASVEC